MAIVDAKQGNIGKTFTDTLTVNGVAVNLTGATVLFRLLRADGSKLSRTATVVTPAAGTVSYTTVAGDLSVAGDALQEWEVTTGGGAVLTFPDKAHNIVRVYDDLA